MVNFDHVVPVRPIEYQFGHGVDRLEGRDSARARGAQATTGRSSIFDSET